MGLGNVHPGSLAWHPPGIHRQDQRRLQLPEHDRLVERQAQLSAVIMLSPTQLP